MVKSMIDKIRETEAQSAKIIADAEDSVKQSINKTKEETKEQAVFAARQIDADAAKIISDAELAAAEIKENGNRKGWAEGEKLSAKADKMRDNAVNEAIRIIFG
jgi:vacuolar-type H+-ATPase subunit H